MILVGQALRPIVMSTYRWVRGSGTKHWDFHCVLCAMVYVCQPIIMIFPRNFDVFALADAAQADKIDLLEKAHGWREEEFDFVLQYLRTILMKRALYDHLHLSSSPSY